MKLDSSIRSAEFHFVTNIKRVHLLTHEATGRELIIWKVDFDDQIEESSLVYCRYGRVVS